MLKINKAYIFYILSFLCFTQQGIGQVVRDTTQVLALPRFTGWVDNNHLKKEEFRDGKTVIKSVNIHTGAEAEIANKKEKNVTIEVKVIDGDIYWIGPTGKEQLTRTEAEEKVPMLSPDGSTVAFLRDNDLYSLDIQTKNEVRHTFDGADAIMNGFASWVYYEEILKRDSEYRAFWWSPDSRYIAFYRFDDRNVPIVPLHNPIGQHGHIEYTRYPKAGDPNPKVKVGLLEVQHNQVRWAKFDEEQDQYFGKPFWRPDGSGLLVQWMPRRQNNLKLIEVNPKTGGTQELYDETQKTWIDWVNRFYWVKDGFVMVRDFEGWEQIYYHDSNGKLRQRLTTGENWQVHIVRIDQKQGIVYYTSATENATRTDFYRVGINGRGQRRLTTGAYSFSKISLSPDGKHFLTQYSNAVTPPKLALVQVESGRSKELADARGAEFDTKRFRNREVLWMETPDGLRLPASITWPRNRVAGKKYPLVVRIYGGPKYQIVTDSWVDPTWSKQDDEEINVVLEHRGAGFNGKAGLDYLYGNLGKWEMTDYIEWIKLLRQNPYVDSSRIMITGGSYGGYLTAMALTYGAGYFNYGIADYPVTDWRLYDSHYTERYMGLPVDNPKGYEFGSVLNHVDNYQRKGDAMLLIQHGIMDDNVHIQNTYQLVDAFQRKNKSFELMVYPTERHGWKGPKIPFTVRAKEAFYKKYINN